MINKLNRDNKGKYIKGHSLGFKKNYIPWNKGIIYKKKSPVTEELKKIWIKNLKGGMKGKHLSEKHKQALSESKKGDKNPMFGIHKYGKDAPFWKGGISKESRRLRSRLRTWRKQILERDNYECCSCLSKDKLRVHHIIPVSIDKLQASDPQNGLTLCDSCHVFIHQSERQYNYDNWNNIKKT